MIIIKQPKSYISNLWGKQNINSQTIIRLMRYIIRDDYNGHTLLQNVVTGQLIELEPGEIQLIDKLPTQYNSLMDVLINNGFLVTSDFNEFEQVVKIRKILQKIESVKSKGITQYTILPTTACNAHCYYCFEHNTKITTMSHTTADDVVKFITNNCYNNPVHIEWFGGEPTIASKCINYICNSLTNKKIQFSSHITTNGYLFDKEMVHQAKNIWFLKSATISLDGSERNYNYIKSYKDAVDNPYQRVLQNVGYLLENGIYVLLRMNFDLNNHRDFSEIVSDIKKRYGNNRFLRVYAHQIDINDQTIFKFPHGDEKWFSEKIFELNSISRSAGLYQIIKKLPYLNHRWCQAANDSSVVITPEGNFISCAEQLGDDQIIGNVNNGICNNNVVECWKQEAYYEKCISCILFPICLRVKNCNLGDKCYNKIENLYQYKVTMRRFAMSHNH